MLTHLSIKNFALIDQLEVSFKNGFSIITGETGAGKSILLGGLGLILGKRADLSVINDTTKKCVVEAEFDISNYKLAPIFKKEELDYEVNTIIRREILASGKSRAFINDSPVPLSTLKLISEQLIDIHSQHQTLQLTDNEFQFEVVDALAKNETTLVKYAKELNAYKKAKKALDELINSEKQSKESLDYNRHLLEELEALQLEQIDQEALEEELEQLSNVEDIQTQLSKSAQLLEDEQMGVLTLLNELKQSVRSISDFGQQYNDLFERINSCHIELEDVYGEISSAQESVEANPERLHQITETLNQLNTLQQKHQVATVAELIAVMQDLADKVNAVTNLDATIQEKREVLQLKEASLNELSDKLHENREKALPKLKAQLEKIVANLGMENARFQLEVNTQDGFLSNGKDELSFLFSANKGGHFNELKKAASGGELSRIMLGIKAILSKYKQLPTIMFDEIDTGVSGDVANKMGMLMHYMSENMQVFSITHLPQIASKGASHYKVYKEDVNDVTVSNLKVLNEEERIKEIAEMLGGKDLSESAMSHARELLNL